MSKPGIRNVNGHTVLPLDGLWSSIAGAPVEAKLSEALEFAGCEFYDEEKRFLGNFTVSLAGLGGVPVASEQDSDESIGDRIQNFVSGSRIIMGSAAAFSYLNSGEKPIDALYDQVTALGHFSVAHTVQTNFVLAGITQATELELSLQRDIVHVSKLTNARTKVQNMPPLAVRNRDDLPGARAIYEKIIELREMYGSDTSADTLEIINGFYPINKATILMLSGDISNLRKLTQLRDDKGKERELRDVADELHQQLLLLWPELFQVKENRTMNKLIGEQPAMNSDFFAEGLLNKLDITDPIYAAYEAQDVSRNVGFDFADFQDVIPRALDEIRETKEAFEEEGPEGREHFGDEIADIMFSLVNLARHAGINEMPAVESVVADADLLPVEDVDTIELIDAIGAKIAAVAEIEPQGEDFIAKIHELFQSGMADAALLAKANGFDPAHLLRENVRKYLVRCQAIEQLASEDGKKWADLSANNEIIAYWKRAKILLK